MVSFDGQVIDVVHIYGLFEHFSESIKGVH